MNVDDSEDILGPAGDDFPEISPASKQRPIPPAEGHIEVNFCRTAGCDNFGIPPRRGDQKQGRTSHDRYRINGDSNGAASIICFSCKKSTRLKSNKAVHEEYDRQRQYLQFESMLSCPDEKCGNFNPSPDTARGKFRRYGKTKSGSDRWQCLACRKTFSLGKATKGHKKPHMNHMVLHLIVNKVSIRRMAEILELSPPSVYGKIDFVYRQCLAFSADRERNFKDLAIPRLYLSTDRQDYLVNWNRADHRAAIQLTAIGTADRESGYVFAFTPNYDASVDIQAVETDIRLNGDAKSAHMRKYARIWTDADYRQSVDMKPRADLDAPEEVDASQQLPTVGAQVHADYLMHGHFWHLRDLFENVEKVRFFIDRDAGLLHACIGAFTDRIKGRSADVFQVEIQKEMSVDTRLALLNKARAWFEAEKRKHPGLNDQQAKTEILAEMIFNKRLQKQGLGRLQDELISIPFPDTAEPLKKVRFVTDMEDYKPDHVANLMLKASLWPIDTLFNRIRRRIAAFERPVTSKRRSGRLWQIYAPYDPGMLTKYLTIFRTWHNYVWVNERTNLTPAEAIGLAKGKIRVQDIIYFDQREKI